MEIDSATRLMHSSLLLIHQSRPLPGTAAILALETQGISFPDLLIHLFVGTEILQKAKAQMGVLKDLYSRLAEIIQECPGQYYRSV